MEISVDQFFEELRLNTNLIGLVGEYNSTPAIAEGFQNTPSGIYITLCDGDMKYQYCAGTSNAISGYLDFTVRIFGIKSTSRSDIRMIRDTVIKELRDMNTACVHAIRIDQASGRMIQPETERPFAVIRARAFFR